MSVNCLKCGNEPAAICYSCKRKDRDSVERTVDLLVAEREKLRERVKFITEDNAVIGLQRETQIHRIEKLEAREDLLEQTVAELNAFDVPQEMVDLRMRLKGLEAWKTVAAEWDAWYKGGKQGMIPYESVKKARALEAIES